jgi:hypothetical protein
MLIRFITAGRLRTLETAAARLPVLETELATSRKQHEADAATIETLPAELAASPAVPDDVQRIHLTAAGLALGDRTLAVWECYSGHWSCVPCAKSDTSYPVSAAEHARQCQAIPRP